MGWRVVPAIPYVGNFATVSRELSTKPLTVFRAGEQAERTKAEHAPDKCVHQTSFANRPVKVPRVSKRANPKRVASFEAVATKGVGVFDTLKAVAKLVLTELKRGG